MYRKADISPDFVLLFHYLLLVIFGCLRQLLMYSFHYT